MANKITVPMEIRAEIFERFQISENEAITVLNSLDDQDTKSGAAYVLAPRGRERLHLGARSVDKMFETFENLGVEAAFVILPRQFWYDDMALIYIWAAYKGSLSAKTIFLDIPEALRA